MNDSDYTPGPWKVVENPFGYDVWGSHKIVQVTRLRISKAREEFSNARLIAAAPELLAACEIGSVADKHNVLDFAASIIEECRGGDWEVARMLRVKAEAERAAIAKATEKEG